MTKTTKNLKTLLDEAIRTIDKDRTIVDIPPIGDISFGNNHKPTIPAGVIFDIIRFEELKEEKDQNNSN